MMAAPLTMRSPILNSNSTNISPSNSTQPMRASAGARRSSSPSLAARTASNAQQNFTSRLPLISGATDRQDQERSHILNESNGMITDRTLDDDTRRTSTPTTTILPGIKDLFPDHRFEEQLRRHETGFPRAMGITAPNLSPVQSLHNGPQLYPSPTHSIHSMQAMRFALPSSPPPSSQHRRARQTINTHPREMPIQSHGDQEVNRNFAFPSNRPDPSFSSRTSDFSGSPLEKLGRTRRSTVSSMVVTTEANVSSSNTNAAAAAAGLLGLSASLPQSSTLATKKGDEPEKPMAMDVDTHPLASNTNPLTSAGFIRPRSLDRSISDADVSADEGDSNDIGEESADADEEEEDELAFDQDDDLASVGHTAPTSVDSHHDVSMSKDEKRKDSLKDASTKMATGSNDSVSTNATTRIERKFSDNSSNEKRESGETGANHDGEGNSAGTKASGGGNDGKRHTCPHCTKRFNRPSSLRIHLNTHTGAKPFECPYPGCGRQFNVSSNMRRHYRNHSSPAGLPVSNAMPQTPGVLSLHSSVQLERERTERIRLQVQHQASSLSRSIHPGDRNIYGPHSSGLPLHRSPQAPSSYRAPIGISRELEQEMLWRERERALGQGPPGYQSYSQRVPVDYRTAGSHMASTQGIVPGTMATRPGQIPQHADIRPQAGTLYASRSESHPYQAHILSHSHPPPNRERYGSMSGSGSPSPAFSPGLSHAMSLPSRSGWQRHAHTHSAPAFAGSVYGPSPPHERVELPPLRMTQVGSPPVRERILPPPAGHSRSHSLSVTGDRTPAASTYNEAREEEYSKWERRERRDSTAARTGHESEHGDMADSASEYDTREIESRQDVMMNGVEELGGRSRARHWNIEGRDENYVQTGIRSSSSVESGLRSYAPSSMHSHYRFGSTSSNDAMASSPVINRDRAHSYSRPHPHSHSYSHSRNGSASSSGHGHGFVSHPYARARHAHSRSRDAASIDESLTQTPPVPGMPTHSPRLSLSKSVSPRATTTVSIDLSSSTSSTSSPRQRAVLNECKESLHNISPQMTYPSKFPSYTFPPPPPPEGLKSSAPSPISESRMEVEEELK